MNFTDLQIPFDEAENYFKPNNKEKLNRLFYKDRNYNKLLNDTTYFLKREAEKPLIVHIFAIIMLITQGQDVTLLVSMIIIK